MKTLIAAAMLLLLALASPAFATDDDGPDIWICPGGVQVSIRNLKIVSVNPRTSLKATTQWNFYGPGPDFIVRLGGKACKIKS